MFASLDFMVEALSAGDLVAADWWARFHRYLWDGGACPLPLY